MAEKEPKLYEQNALAQLRLTKERADIRMFLNQLRVEGKDISIFISDAIREKAGLRVPDPNEYIEPVAAQPQITAEFMEQLTQQILDRIQSQGLLVAPSGDQSDSQESTKINEKVKVMSEEVKKSIMSALDWD
jgi:hypothetical protein